MSSKKLGVRSDSSAKFEKNLDPNNVFDAMNRACQLITELGAGDVVEGIVDVYPIKRNAKTIPFQPNEINRLLGINIAKEEMIKYLRLPTKTPVPPLFSAPAPV